MQRARPTDKGRKHNAGPDERRHREVIVATWGAAIVGGLLVGVALIFLNNWLSTSHPRSSPKSNTQPPPQVVPNAPDYAASTSSRLGYDVPGTSRSRFSPKDESQTASQVVTDDPGRASLTTSRVGYAAPPAPKTKPTAGIDSPADAVSDTTSQPSSRPSQTASVRERSVAAQESAAQHLLQELQSPNEADRIENFRHAINDAKSGEKGAVLRTAFETGDPELQALATKEVIKTGGQLTVEVPDDAPDSPFTAAMRSLHIRTGSFDLDSGRFDSGFTIGANGKLAYGTVSTNGVVITGTAVVDDREVPLSLSLKPDKAGTLVGKAHSNNHECPVRIGLI